MNNGVLENKKVGNGGKRIDGSLKGLVVKR